MAGLDINGGTNQITPQSGVGGGNIFNMAPLFGDVFGQSATSSGDNPVSTPGGNSANAPKGSASTNTASTTPTGGGSTFNLSAYLPWLLGGVAALAVLWGIVEIFKRPK